MAKRFNKIGLRRDLNFSDLVSPTASLNNLLSGLVDVIGESFISDDLDAIRDIRTSTITNDDFRNVAGAALKVTNSSGDLEIYKPILKFKNRLDVAKFTIGEPNFYGGNGLTARTYDDTKINSTAVSSSNIFTGTPNSTEIFWERGIFEYVSKIHDTFNNIYGGVEWNGYFRPTANGVWAFNLSTTGFDTFEFDDGTGALVLQHRKSQYEYSFQIASALAGATTLTLTTPANANNLFVGDVLIHPTIVQFEDPLNIGYTGTEVTITAINRTTGVITISAALSLAITSATNFTFRHKAGEISGSFSVSTQNLEAYRTYRVRIRFWVPNIPQITVRARKAFALSVTPPNSTGTWLNYKWLYDENYNINPTPGALEYGDFRQFYTNRLTLGGGTVGGTVYNDYQSVITKSPLNITYSAPLSLVAITKQTKTVSYTTNINFVGIPITDNIEVGNYVFSSGAGIINGTQVKEITINSGVFLTNNPTSTVSGATFTFVDHRGLITYSLAASHTSGSQTITGLTSTTALTVGDVVISAGSPTYNVITKILSSSSVTTSKAFTAGLSSGRVFFYRNRGLRDIGLTTYCTNVFSAPTVAQSNSGANTLTLAYTDNLVVGQKAQYGTRIPAGTTITNINTTTKVVTLSAALTDDIPVNQLITFAPAATPNADNKEICFPPIDTSPPFTATSLGLATTSGRPIMDIAPTVAGSGVLKFVGLSADGVTTTTTSSSATYNRQLTIKDGAGNTYKILATT